MEQILDGHSTVQFSTVYYSVGPDWFEEVVGADVGDMSTATVPVTLSKVKPLLSFSSIKKLPLATALSNAALALLVVMPSDTVIVYISVTPASSLRVGLVVVLMLLVVLVDVLVASETMEETVRSVTVSTEGPSAVMMLNSTAEAKSVVERAASGTPVRVCIALMVRRGEGRGFDCVRGVNCVML